METLVELVAKITADAAEFKKALAESETGIKNLAKKTETETKSITQQFKDMGKTQLAIGASITASMMMIIKAFTSTGSELNDLSLKTGVSVKALAGLQYAAEQGGTTLGTVEMAIKRTATAMEEAKDSATGSSKAFDKIGLSLTDLQGLNPEQQFLKIANAIANISDPMTRAAVAVDLFGRSGTDMLPMLSEGAEGLNKMMVEGQKLTGWTDEGAKSADAIGDAFGTVKTAVGGLFNSIATQLAPTIKDITDKITGAVKWVKDWADQHPGLVKNIGMLVGVLGVMATTIGVVTMATMALTAALHANPIGLIILAIEGLVAAGILLWQNWDKVAHFFSDLWSNMKNAVLHAVDFILGALQKFVGFIPWLGDKITEAREKIAEMINAEVIARDAKDVERSAKGMTATIKAELEKQKADTIASYATQKQAAKDLYDSNIRKIKEEYGELKTESKNKMDLARDASDATKRALDEELKQAQRTHDYKMDFLQSEYDQKIKTLNAEADYQITSIQNQIDAIDKQTDAEGLALTRTAEATRLQELATAHESASTAEDKAQAKKEWDEYATEVARNELLRQRAVEKDALRDQIDDIRTRAKTETDRLAEELDAQKNNLNAEWQVFQDNQTRLSDLLDAALVAELKRLDDERIAKEKFELATLKATQTRLTNEETALKTSFDARLTEAAVYQAALESVLRDINQTVTTTYVTVGEPPTTVTMPPGGHEVPEFASGGIVNSPTLAMVGEAGPEAIVPLEDMTRGDIIINFTQPFFVDREDQLYKLADIIRKAVQRQDRLRFGKAYNGGVINGY
jgi:hypothetical protein